MGKSGLGLAGVAPKLQKRPDWLSTVFMPSRMAHLQPNRVTQSSHGLVILRHVTQGPNRWLACARPLISLSL